MKTGDALQFLRLITLSSAGEEPACFERKHFDETDARLFRDTDFYSQVLHKLPRPQTQTELVTTESAR